MKRLLLMVVVVGMAGATVGQAGGKKSDKDKLQGKWEVTGMVAMGVDVTKEALKSKMIFTFAGNKVAVKDGDKKEEETTYTLDDTKKPKHLTVAKTATEPEMKAIYSLEGDTLKFAMLGEDPSKNRPTTFDSKDLVVFTLKRLKN